MEAKGEEAGARRVDGGGLDMASWWRCDGITCFISTHTGSRRAQREAGSRSDMAFAGHVARFRGQRIH